MTFILIDYSVIVARPWGIGNLNNVESPVWFYGRNEYFAQYLKEKNDIIHYLRQLVELPVEKIESVVYSVPAEWGLKPNEADALVRFLDRRRADVARKMNENLSCLKA